MVEPFQLCGIDHLAVIPRLRRERTRANAVFPDRVLRPNSTMRTLTPCIGPPVSFSATVPLSCPPD